ncbi:dihydrolipoamide acetyltransferase family protein [Nocardioides lijunqiniae]|uniref:dihydrolipoamide acetyltransferase family protein n=1 Tax=Nocardioides lijunqiniae TaxID=2760832 RepID=UPI00187766AA|nr:dihydrolipoamide acetyltransferase family protein [Nocardioides lijunqiniae]
MPEYLLPDVGEGLIEAEIVTWKVKVGDVVAINDIVVEIETAKSLVELPSPYAGEVTDLLVAEGETVSVGTPIIAIGEKAAAPAPAMEIDLSNPAASGRVEGESLVGRNKAERGPQRRARKGSVTPASEAAANTQMQVQGAFAPGGAQSQDVVPADEPAVPAVSAAPVEPEPVSEFVPAQALTSDEVRVLAKPPVRKLAKDLGIDLASLRATGPNGTVTRADVEAAANSSSPVVEEVAQQPSRDHAPRSTGERETREPIKGVRKMMASAMVGSAFSAPHVTEWVTVDVTRTMELVDRLKQRREFRDVRVSPLLVLARAVTLAVRRTPEINSFWDEAAQEVVLKHYVNLGIAAATPRGLVVPNVKDAQDLTLLELAGELNQLTATAREGKTQPAQMSGGTFTITNVGVFGVDAGTPIINPGESAILCFGAIKKQPWVVTTDGVDEIVPRQVTTLALSFDHRHIDGEKGSRFLADVAGILEDPASALLF